jgi:hypothetical protein
MNLRGLWILAVLVVLPGTLHAAQPRVNPGAMGSAGTVHLDNALLERVIPLLRLEATSANAFWWDQQPAAQRTMTKQEYVALKNALMTAKLDSADARRVSALPFDDGSRAARQANVTVYRANAARVDSALAGVPVDPGCVTCATAPLAPGGRR